MKWESNSGILEVELQPPAGGAKSNRLVRPAAMGTTIGEKGAHRLVHLAMVGSTALVSGHWLGLCSFLVSLQGSERFRNVIQQSQVRPT